MEPRRDGDAHLRYEGMAVSHVLGGLSEPHARDFRAHLLECADCRARVGELRAIAHELADIERDERRERAAKALETKRREVDEDDEERAPVAASGGRTRLLLVVGLLLLAGLAAWNIMLRGSVMSLEGSLRARQDAAAALEFGDPWSVSIPVSEVSGSVKEHDGMLVLLVEGLKDDQVYGLYLLDRQGKTLDRMGVRAVDGRVFPPPLAPLPESVAELLITQPTTALNAEPTGRTILRAQAGSSG